MNYCDLLFDTDEKYLDREVIIDLDNEKRLTYRELEESVEKVAAFLKSKGYTAGSVISTHLYNSAEVAIVLLAVQYIGAVICLIDPLFKVDELDYYLEDSESISLITHLSEAEYKHSLKSEVEIIEIKEIEEVLKQALSKEVKMYDFDENELAMLLYTSGSTSTPKGVMLSTGCFYTFLKKSNQSMYVYDINDKLLCYVPFSHAYGSVSLLIPVLAHKAAIVFLRSFHPLKVAETISSENITHIFGVPTHYQQLLRYDSIIADLRKLKGAFCAAAPLSYDTASSWLEKTGVYLDEGYGMTETSTLIATRMSMLPEPSGNVGLPPEGIIEVQAVDENGQKVDDGIIGELIVKGSGMMLGYLNRPDETAEVMKSGWIYTGDYGYRRSDGSFVISGRKKEFINVAGLKISPIEIEAALNSHPDVIDSAAIGIEDKLYGELVKAFVVKKEDSTVSERELIKYLSSKLANFKLPRFISFLEEFPRNNIGKIAKKELKNIQTV
ncbi:class I adenylate-forming enzyme family protein [Natronospora cellulosivora (SeqCode)]